MAGAALAAADFFAGAVLVAGAAFLRRRAAPLTAAVPFAGASFAAFFVVAATVRPELACLPVAFVAVPALALAAGRAAPAFAADAFDPVVEVAALRAAGRADAAATTVFTVGLLAAATTAFRVVAGPAFAAFDPPVFAAALPGADGATTVFAVDGRAGFCAVEAVLAVDGPAVAAAPGFDAPAVLPTGPTAARSGAGFGARVPAPVPAFVLVRRAATAPDLVAAGGAAFARSAMASPSCKTGARRAAAHSGGWQGYGT